MQWTRPDFQEVTLGMEVTAYVNTDDEQPGPDERVRRADSQGRPAEAGQEPSA